MSKLYNYIKKHSINNPESISFTYRSNNEYMTISYKQLYDFINNTSLYLKEYKNKTIAIIGNNKLEYAISLLSIICCTGDAFLIDKELNKEDIEEIFKQKKPNLIIIYTTEFLLSASWSFVVASIKKMNF